MSFNKNNIKDSYISYGDDNIATNLIIPALRECRLYRRSVAFFSSSVLEILQPGLIEFIKNRGKIQLIVSPELNKQDVEIIKSGEENKEKYIKDLFLKKFEEDLESSNLSNLDILYNLVAQNILEVKIVSVKNEFGIYHDKLGILTDFDNNNIIFYGSANSSKNAYVYNYEKVRVINSFIDTDKHKIEDEINEFDDLWYNNNAYIDTYSFMDAIRDSVIRIREQKKIEENKKRIKLYDYQEEAIQHWVKNGYKGFYVMATGTGKTFTAIYSAKELLKDHEAIIVILAPYKHLIKQWYYDVKDAFDKSTIVLISSENSHWDNEVKNAVMQNKYGDEKKQIILISTIKSFYLPKFDKALKSSTTDRLLIVDEAHRFTHRTDDILVKYKYLLGLSATPHNGKNIAEGTKLTNFFGGKVFDLPIEIALQKKKLVPYVYNTFYIQPTESEMFDFIEITRNMASCFKKNILIDEEKFNKNYRARLRLISNLDEKIKNIPNFIKKSNVSNHFIVYCGDGRFYDSDDENETEIIRYLDYVKRILNDSNFKTCQFTCDENMNRREEIINMFNNNDIDSIVAIKCLDEGINIPSIQSALILSSNDNYREFVQRRGRILRKYEGKSYASIFDVIALPSGECPGMAKIELRRYYEYARLAINADEKLKELEMLLGNYSLTLDDIAMYDEYDYEGDLDE